MNTDAIGVMLANLEHDADNPVVLSDGELLLLAAGSTEELRRRMPRYALEQGDLPECETETVEAAEAAAEAAKRLKETWPR